MSLRRSTRISATTASTVPESAAYKRVTPKPSAKPTNVTKKRKSRASNTTMSPPKLSREEAAESIFAPDTQPIFAVPELPATPLPKRRKAASESPSKPPPFTPTPSGVGLLSHTHPSGGEHPFDSPGNLKPRPAEPRATNAPLSTPGGSRVVAYTSSPAKPSTPSASQEAPGASPSKKRKAKETVPPDVGVLNKPTATIDTLLKEAEEFLCKVDPKLKPLVEKHKCKVFSPEGLREVVDPFTALSSGIVGQQVSGQAAASIRKKFTALFPDTHPSFPSPSQVLTKDLPTLRTAGLSQRKAEYISGLADKFVSGELSASMLISASDEELIEKLVAVRGLGRWSVEMFACFGLKRMDVFSTGDLGVQRGMATYMGRDTSKLKAKGGKWKYMSEAEMLSIASRFSPYRSLFMWYMWRIEDVDISVMQTT
ncbi:DNA glycosylase [Karstenula rhodostoma CBS 690.94]|uniref:DNA glycosylase n=1 Tax=Karstenula rhodostoma CBS 690.94 TaxID=1392251 RepID=A0A9P4PD21_9PLEO|nr:DNA glycosylase [Karstenula rhodostoma CBS 690.94]